jgi:predicted outer membrane protein
LQRFYSRVGGAGALILLVLAGPAGAQTTSAGATPVPPAASLDGDRAEVTAIVMQSVSEVKLCGLAAEKSQDTDVRSLCRKASADSAQDAVAGLQLAQTLGARGLKVQSSPDTSALLEKLARYSGREFDREFLLAQINDGAADEQAIEFAARFTPDKSVKSYEDNVLPKIANRVELAEGALRRISETQPY